MTVSVAANSFEGIGTENPQLATSIVDNTLFLERFQRSVRAFATHAGESTEVGLGKRNLELDRPVAYATNEVGEIKKPTCQTRSKLAARPLERGVDDPASSLSQCSRQLNSRERVALEQLREEARIEAKDRRSHDRYRVEGLGQSAECCDVADDFPWQTKAQDRFAPLRVAGRHFDDARANEVHSIDPVPGQIEPLTRHQRARDGSVDQP